MLIPKAAGDLVKGEEFLWNTDGVWRLYRCTEFLVSEPHSFRRTCGLQFWPESLEKTEGAIYVYMAPIEVPGESVCRGVELMDHTIVLVSSNKQPMEKELTSVC